MGYKILLIDDDETLLLLLDTLFDMEGFEVLHVDQNLPAEQIVASIKSKTPDILLCDVYLAHLDGFELLRHLRAEKDLKQLRVLMSSGLDASHRCAEEGADGFILKPYMPDELMNKVRQILAETTTTN